MKQILSLVVGVFATFTLSAQPPMNPPQGRQEFQRQLPNQFRDFVDHQQRWNMERPKIEKKDGKVIITMSEQHFNRMRQMRQRPPFRQVNLRNQNCCNLNCRPQNMRGPRRPRS